MGLTRGRRSPIIAGMMKFTLPLALLGLLLTPACRPLATPGSHDDAHEEATPMSELDAHEFSNVTPQQRRR